VIGAFPAGPRLQRAFPELAKLADVLGRREVIVDGELVHLGGRWLAQRPADASPPDRRRRKRGGQRRRGASGDAGRL
jgi:hypothetical protein